jgi:hypothetical protein
MTEVERLHYVNGRRLDAGDLRLEQHYHIAMRRLLNRGLFTPGVVNGFNVVAANQKEVYVEPGLGLDPLGREVVLPELRTMPVPVQPATSNAEGYFLVIRYAEERLAGADPDCGPPISEAARIREEPVLEWTERPPFHLACRKGIGDPLDCGIVLALVRLTDQCQISLIDISVREFAFPANASRVTGVALEGEKDIDTDNPKVLHFQIRGGTPSAVLLYLWGGKFSSLYYTELGEHAHAFDKPTGSATTSLAAHTHSLSGHTHGLPSTSPGGGHNHLVRSSRTEAPASDWLQRGVIGGNPGEVFGVPGGPPFIALDGVHVHDFVDANGNPVPTSAPTVDQTGGAVPTGAGSETHTHSIPETLAVGVDDVAARSGVGELAHKYLSNLRVGLDGTDVTDEILATLPTSWGQLGDGLGTHPLVIDGTGSIDLLDVARAAGRTIAVGPHELVFRVASGGGKVLYNLIVE